MRTRTRLAISLLCLVLAGGGALLAKRQADNALAASIEERLLPLARQGLGYRLVGADVLAGTVQLEGVRFLPRPGSADAGINSFAAARVRVERVAGEAGAGLVDMVLDSVELRLPASRSTFDRIKLSRVDLGALAGLAGSMPVAAALAMTPEQVITGAAEATNLRAETLQGPRLAVAWLNWLPRPARAGCAAGFGLFSDGLQVEGASMLDPTGLTLGLGDGSRGWQAESRLDVCRRPDGGEIAELRLMVKNVLDVEIGLAGTGLAWPAEPTEQAVDEMLGAVTVERLTLGLADRGGLGQISDQIAATMGSDRMMLAQSAATAFADLLGKEVLDQRAQGAITNLIALSAPFRIEISVNGGPTPLPGLADAAAAGRVAVRIDP